MAKRWLLLVATNVAAVVIITIVLMILPLDMTTTWGLAGICLIVGLAGAFVSLWLSVPIAKNLYGVREARGDDPVEARLHAMISEVAERAGIATPEVGVYESEEPNAFATGPDQKRALIAVSTGLLTLCSDAELRGVIAHEVGHIRSGDMVTMTLLMGIANAFVLFLARIVARAIDSMVQSDDNPFGMGIWAYWILVWVLETLFMILAYIPISWYSRHREYAADATAAALGSKEGLVAALRKIDGTIHSDEEQAQTEKRRDMYAFSKLSNKKKVLLFATHPPTESRIEYLETGEIPKLAPQQGAAGMSDDSTSEATQGEFTGKRFTLVHAVGSAVLFLLVFVYAWFASEVTYPPNAISVFFPLAWLGLAAWGIATVVGVGAKAIGRSFFVRIGPYVTGAVGVTFVITAIMLQLGVVGTLAELLLVAAHALLFVDAVNAKRNLEGKPAARLSLEWVKRAFTSDEGFSLSRFARIAMVGGVALIVAFSNISGDALGGSGGSSARSGRATRSSQTSDRVPSYVKTDVIMEYGYEFHQIVGIEGRMTRRTPIGGEMWKGSVDVQLVPGGIVQTLPYVIVHE